MTRTRECTEPEEELLLKLLAEDIRNEDHWSRFCKIYNERLIAFLRYRFKFDLVTCDGLAHDTIVEFFIEQRENPEGFKVSSKVWAWLRTACFRNAIDHLRLGNKKGFSTLSTSQFDEESRVNDDRITPMQEAEIRIAEERRIIAIAIMQCLDQVPKEAKECLMEWVNGARYPTIAALQGVGHGTVGNRIMVARNQVRACLEGRL